jgi:hypothetical protein
LSLRVSGSFKIVRVPLEERALQTLRLDSSIGHLGQLGFRGE